MPRHLVILVLLLPSVLTTDAADLRIDGMRPAAATNALNFLRDRLEYVKEGSASSSRADDAAFLLERHLIQSGYNSPEVTWSLPNKTTILLTVDPGDRSTLGKVRVEGMTGPLAEEVRTQIQSAHKEVKRLLVEESVPYLPERNAEALANATNLLKSKGYWDAAVTLPTPERDAATGAVTLVASAQPGPLYHLAPPVILERGTPNQELNTSLADPKVDPKVDLVGEPATTTEINLIRATVEKHYRKNGFQFAEVDMEILHKDGSTQLTFRVTPGRQFRVGNFEIVGNEEVKTRRIAERFDEFPGSKYNADKVDDRIKQLFGTGAFQTLRLDPFPTEDGIIDFTLHVKEGKPEGYYAHVGAGSYEGFILGGGYYHRNIFGNLWNFSTGFEISSLGLLGDVRVTDPWFLGRDMRFTPRAFLLTRSYDGYDKFEGGLGTSLEWDVNEYYTIALELQNSFVSVSSDGIPTAELGPNNYSLTTLGLRQVYDRRNDPILPSRGYYLELETGLGLAVGDGDISFSRIEGQLAAFQPVIEDVSHLAASLRGGMIIPSGDTEELPIDLRFFSGGANSVRSFTERDLGPKASSGDPRGGEAYWTANLEYIHTIKGPLRGVVFLDAGTLSPDHSQFGEGVIKYAAGLGLRLDLPIGPVRLEYGHALSPDEGDPSGAFHFAIGATF